MTTHAKATYDRERKLAEALRQIRVICENELDTELAVEESLDVAAAALNAYEQANAR